MTSNRFDLLRLVFASTVFVFHAVALSAYAPGGSLERVLGELAGLAVEGFFIVSGALVFGSFERSRSLGLYTEKRARRIYPAYALVVVIPARNSMLRASATSATASTSRISRSSRRC
ncbi:acyltransferase family protein [Henriciella litoralis]|uniref:acyltransferase family protein n=1 Tax=Henriciella litoralis TaxID=568102 RepID=UPI002D219BF5|nr:acyltransferase family protein [Henriciella litoralis]